MGYQLPLTVAQFALFAAIFIAAALLSLVITPLVIRGASALHLYDAPDGVRRLHPSPVPRLGGVAVYLAMAAVCVPVLLYGASLFWTRGVIATPEVEMYKGLLYGSALLFVVGVVDDVRGLPPSLKFAAQVGAALIAWYFGVRLQTATLGYGEGVQVGILAMPLVLIWIVGVTNAYNFIDGLNGLAGGIAIVACAAIIPVSIWLGHMGVIIPTIALAGALFGFMRYNFPRAKIFLGDAGSMSVGFLLSVLLLKAAEARGGSKLIVAVPLLAFCVPLLDVFLAVLRRWLRGVPLSGADARHIHHRLMALGLSQQRTAIVLWCLAAGMAAFGLLVALTAPYVATSFAIAAVIGLCIAIIYGTNLLSYDELIVAGEVLFTAPSRFRRVISDQILAHDLTARIQSASMVDEVTSLLTSAAPSFGFLRMELVRESRSHRTDEEAVGAWAWKLEYPLRPRPEDSNGPNYKLAIWCSAEHNVRPYGAERAAKIIAPGLERWLLSRGADLDTPAEGIDYGLDASGARRRRRLSLFKR
jgi:UDP-GlcNAc:undecaprenyl-phosphate GlcNAc-1-phosphate transferase